MNYAAIFLKFLKLLSILAKNQLAGNLWKRYSQCIGSISFAKRNDVVTGILQVNWDLVIIDEAHEYFARIQGNDLRRTGLLSQRVKNEIIDLLSRTGQDRAK